MNMKNRVTLAAFAALFGCFSSAKAETFKSEYSVTLWALPVAKMNFTTEIGPSAYSVSGSVKSSALADVVENTRGTVSASGKIGKGALVPANFDVKYTSGKKNKRTTIGFNGGNVASFDNVPPTRKRAPWIEVDPVHLKAALDPMSAFIVKAASLNQVCGRTLRLFDGEMRTDIKLTSGSQSQFSVPGYEGTVVTCGVRVLPISGYRKGKKQIEYIKNSTNMSLTFAPIGQTGTYAPVLARIGTQIGTVTVKASRFGQ